MYKFKKHEILDNLLHIYIENEEWKEIKATWPWIKIDKRHFKFFSENINWKEEIAECLSDWNTEDSFAQKLDKQLNQKYQKELEQFEKWLISNNLFVKNKVIWEIFNKDSKKVEEIYVDEYQVFKKKLIRKQSDSSYKGMFEEYMKGSDFVNKLSKLLPLYPYLKIEETDKELYINKLKEFIESDEKQFRNEYALVYDESIQYRTTSEIYNRIIKKINDNLILKKDIRELEQKVYDKISNFIWKQSYDLNKINLEDINDIEKVLKNIYEFNMILTQLTNYNPSELTNVLWFIFDNFEQFISQLKITNPKFAKISIWPITKHKVSDELGYIDIENSQEFYSKKESKDVYLFDTFLVEIQNLLKIYNPWIYAYIKSNNLHIKEYIRKVGFSKDLLPLIGKPNRIIWWESKIISFNLKWKVETSFSKDIKAMISWFSDLLSYSNKNFKVLYYGATKSDWILNKLSLYKIFWFENKGDYYSQKEYIWNTLHNLMKYEKFDEKDIFLSKMLFEKVDDIRWWNWEFITDWTLFHKFSNRLGKGIFDENSLVINEFANKINKFVIEKDYSKMFSLESDYYSEFILFADCYFKQSKNDKETMINLFLSENELFKFIYTLYNKLLRYRFSDFDSYLEEIIKIFKSWKTYEFLSLLNSWKITKESLNPYFIIDIAPFFNLSPLELYCDVNETFSNIYKAFIKNDYRFINERNFLYRLNKTIWIDLEVTESEELKNLEEIKEKKTYLKNLVDPQLEAYLKIKKWFDNYGGMLVADGVWLWKTFEWSSVIWETILTTNKDVLIIAPHSVVSWQGWQRTLKTYFSIDEETIEGRVIIVPNDFFNLSKTFQYIKEKWIQIWLVVIDEAHHFRNNLSKSYMELKLFLNSQNPYVLLLTATPINNSLQDLISLINLFNNESFLKNKEAMSLDEDEIIQKKLVPFVHKNTRDSIIRKYWNIKINWNELTNETPIINAVEIIWNEKQNNALVDFINDTLSKGLEEYPLIELFTSKLEDKNTWINQFLDIFGSLKEDLKSLLLQRAIETLNRKIVSSEFKNEFIQNYKTFWNPFISGSLIKFDTNLENFFLFINENLNNLVQQQSLLFFLFLQTDKSILNIETNDKLKEKTNEFLENMNYLLTQLKKFIYLQIENIFKQFDSKIADNSITLTKIGWEIYLNSFIPFDLYSNIDKNKSIFLELDSDWKYNLDFIKNLFKDERFFLLKDYKDELKKLLNEFEKFIWEFKKKSSWNWFISPLLWSLILKRMDSSRVALLNTLKKVAYKESTNSWKASDSDYADYDFGEVFAQYKNEIVDDVVDDIIRNLEGKLPIDLITYQDNKFETFSWSDMISHLTTFHEWVSFSLTNSWIHWTWTITSFFENDLTNILDSKWFILKIIEWKIGDKINKPEDYKIVWNVNWKKIEIYLQNGNNKINLWTEILDDIFSYLVSLMQTLDITDMTDRATEEWESDYRDNFVESIDDEYEEDDEDNYDSETWKKKHRKIWLSNPEREELKKVLEKHEDFLNQSDWKIEKVKELIIKESNEKWIIFTAYKDTLEYIYQELKNSFPNINIQSISWWTNRNSRTLIINKFSPEVNWIKDIDISKQIKILVTTDTLSEWVNLHDCARQINYDLPFNPVKLQQRIWRLYRIWAKRIPVVYNFVPTFFIEKLLWLLKKISFKESIAKEFFWKLDVNANETDKLIDAIKQKMVESENYKEIIKDEKKTELFLGLTNKEYDDSIEYEKWTGIMKIWDKILTKEEIEKLRKEKDFWYNTNYALDFFNEYSTEFSPMQFNALVENKLTHVIKNLTTKYGDEIFKFSDKKYYICSNFKSIESHVKKLLIIPFYNGDFYPWEYVEFAWNIGRKITFEDLTKDNLLTSILSIEKLSNQEQIKKEEELLLLQTLLYIESEYDKLMNFEKRVWNVSYKNPKKNYALAHERVLKVKDIFNKDNDVKYIIAML